MPHRGPGFLLFFLCLHLVPGQPSAEAQEAARPEITQRFFLDFDLVVGDAVGPFSRAVDGAGGFQLGARWVPSPRSRVGYRLDAGVLTYGSESSEVCLDGSAGCRVSFNLSTTYDIVYLGVGPELRMAGHRAYLFGTLGFSEFSTTSSLWGANVLAGPLAREDNFSDAVFGIRAGGGLRFRVAGRYRPLLLDLGAEFHRNGTASYLVEGGLIENPDGSVTIAPSRSEANIYSVRIGLSFAPFSSRPPSAQSESRSRSRHAR